MQDKQVNKYFFPQIISIYLLSITQTGLDYKFSHDLLKISISTFLSFECGIQVQKLPLRIICVNF